MKRQLGKKLPPFVSRQVIVGSYYFPKQEPAGEGVQIIGAGREDCARNYRVYRERGFEMCAFELVESGEFLLKINGQKRVLGPGSIFVYTEDTVYEMLALGGDPIRKYFTCFRGSEVLEYLRQFDLRGGTIKRVSRPQLLVGLFDQLVECANLPDDTAKPLSRDILNLIMRRSYTDNYLMQEPMRQSEQTYQKICHVISHHYIQISNIAQLAEICGISTAYLSRIFKKFANQTPLQYLTKRRMNYAAQTLLESGMDAKQVAIMLGYDDVFHFSRVFKRVHGVSPRNYVLAKDAEES